MAKINSNALRVKKRLNWLNIYKTQNSTNYIAFFIHFLQINESLQMLFSQLNSALNERLMNWSFKRSTLSTGHFSKNNLHPKLLKKSGNTKRLRWSLSNFLTHSLNFESSELTFRRSGSFIANGYFPIVSPKFLVSTLLELLKIATRKKQGAARESNFQQALSSVLLQFLSIFKRYISGVKVIFAGKWKKTSSGRKQVFCLKFGKMRNISASSLNFYEQLHQKTRFGSCNLKLWVSFKPTNV